VSIEEAVRQATAAIGQGTVVLIDAADATSSGASGDSNAVLRGLIDGGYPGKALFPIVDAPAVAQAIATGIGATVTVDIGGTLDPVRFTPLRVTGTVRVIHDGEVDSESHPGVIWHAGPSVVLQVGRHAVCITSRAVHLYDRSLFYALGQDAHRFDCVIQKSPHCQDRFFRDWVKELIGVDAPGSTSANLPYLGHTVCPRPMYPMEKDATFTPNVQVFSR
jgi:microcystin degradation protein MlrC